MAAGALACGVITVTGYLWWASGDEQPPQRTADPQFARPAQSNHLFDKETKALTASCREGRQSSCVELRQKRTRPVEDPFVQYDAASALCEQGDGELCHALAYSYHHGAKGYPKNVVVAAKWYAAGCSAGHAVSCNNLGALTFQSSTYAGVAAITKSCALGYSGPACEPINDLLRGDLVSVSVRGVDIADLLKRNPDPRTWRFDLDPGDSNEAHFEIDFGHKTAMANLYEIGDG